MVGVLISTITTQSLYANSDGDKYIPIEKQEINETPGARSLPAIMCTLFSDNLYFQFQQNLGVVCISILNRLDGSLTADYVDTSVGFTWLSLPSGSGNYKITITVPLDSSTYYGYFTK